jgi:hypothetical protein
MVGVSLFACGRMHAWRAGLTIDCRGPVSRNKLGRFIINQSLERRKYHLRVPLDGFQFSVPGCLTTFVNATSHQVQVRMDSDYWRDTCRG